MRPGGPGAAESYEPRQVREEATVRRYIRVPPSACPDIFNLVGFSAYPKTLWNADFSPQCRAD